MLASSYHIFIYSFTFNNKEIKKILKTLKKHNWMEINFETEFKDSQAKEDYFNSYAVFQYFNEQTRSVLFHENDAVKDFELYHNGKKINNGKYAIRKEKEVFSLKINSIRLKIFCSGCGLLIFDLSNDQKISIDDLNKINEYGRRLSLPFIASNPHPLVSDSIEIFVDDEKIASEDFKAIISRLNDDFLSEKNKFSYYYESNLISKLLPIEHETSDDRMFVCSLFRKDDLMSKYCEYSDGEYAFLNANELYKFIFVETSLSCQNKNMKKRILEKSTYARWIDYGTLYGITPHSFVCLTGEDEFLKYSVINPFLHHYVEMVCLALIQRDFIALMLNEISKVSMTKQEDMIFIKSKFLEFENKIFLSKVTMQEQGIELFDLIREKLDIDEEYEILLRKLNIIGIL